ncbi:MAG: aspartate aminotransferase family protein [Phycisphaerae bacterium]
MSTPVKPARRSGGAPLTAETAPPHAADRTAPIALGDIPAATFAPAMHRVADMVVDFLAHVGDRPVSPAIAPGAVRAQLPATPPPDAEPLHQILDDYNRVIEPNTTHWNHPSFMAYFSSSGSAPGVLGETLAAALNVNAMLWRTGPAATELEEHVCDWLRQMLALPDEFVGHINDTASIGSLLALAAARHRCGDAEIRQRGMAARSDLPALVVYASEQAHSSIEKAAITLGIGLDHVRKIVTDDAFRMDVSALTAAIAADRAAGRRPIAIVATAGTTSTTSVDPLKAIARIARAERLWYHVDAAHAGAAAICPEYRPLFDGFEQADSIVVNPHKWLYTQKDCSVLLVREPAALRSAFSLIPEYLRTTEAGATNLMDYGVQLGRRFRALKLWMVIRAFGVRGIQERIRYHCGIVQALAKRIREADAPAFEVCAPTPFSTVCFRALVGATPEAQDAFNEKLLAALNETRAVFLSHTKLRGRFVLRMSVGNLRTTAEHVEAAWSLIRATASAQVCGG